LKSSARGADHDETGTGKDNTDCPLYPYRMGKNSARQAQGNAEKPDVSGQFVIQNLFNWAEAREDMGGA